eukprot:TRINITY_DN8033_c0_g1_i2.p1 TRINITY_DN8033_c0_g1~~TRINITY_DN8033_c0_g1_i2.p1  ORF type:complete len:354 (+),score=74.71 TRINITY_DN8033_c0_g1_i2:62-1123(+)
MEKPPHQRGRVSSSESNAKVQTTIAKKVISSKDEKPQQRLSREGSKGSVDGGRIQFTIMTKQEATPIHGSVSIEETSDAQSAETSRRESLKGILPQTAPSNANTTPEVDLLQSILSQLDISKENVPSTILDANMRIDLNGLSKFGAEHTEAFVVGVLGGQGCGKSTVASAIAGDLKLFPRAAKEHIRDGTSCTVGIQAALSPENAIVLDTQPLLSSATLYDLMSEKTDLPPECQSAEQALELMSLRQALLVHCISQVVVVVFDNMQDLSLLKLLYAANILRRQVMHEILSKPSEATNASLNSDSSQVFRSYLQDVKYVFVYNKAPLVQDENELRDKIESWVRLQLQPNLGKFS